MQRLNDEKLNVQNNGWPHFFFQTSDGIKIHYVREGKGQPVLLLHGWPGFWYDWRRVIPELSEHCDVIAPDFRGYGESDKPNLPPHIGYTPEVYASDLKGLIESLGLRDVILAAHDIGATVAQTFVRNHPGYVKGLVLLNPPYPGIGERRFDPGIQKEFWYQHLHNIGLAEVLIGDSEENTKKYISYFYNHWKGSTTQLETHELEYILKMYSRPGHFNSSIQYYRARASSKTSKAVNQSVPSPIKEKTKVLWGEDDPVIPVSWSDRLSDHFLDVSLETLPGAGHFVPFEAPEKVVETILNLIFSEKIC